MNTSFPDGTPISPWFSQRSPRPLIEPVRWVTEYGIKPDSNTLLTGAIQELIDRISQRGGGTLAFPAGIFRTGALFFKSGCNLHLAEGAILLGSDDIADYPLQETRIEGQTRTYFAALINADHHDGFTLSGKGIVDGNGGRAWKHFWLRIAFNPQATNVDEMRSRILYVAHSDDVEITGVTFQNSPFWSTHYHRCNRLKIMNIRVTSPSQPVPAPSTDAIDLDVCHQVLICNCYFAVNDDGIALKGGKGVHAHEHPDNGAVSQVLIHNCDFGFCHAMLTCGSEALEVRNVLLADCRVRGSLRALNLKMRPDTSQSYEYLQFDGVTGQVDNLLAIAPWTQFFNLEDATRPLVSTARHILFSNLDLTCRHAFDTKDSPDYELSDLRFQNTRIQEQESSESDLNFVRGLNIDAGTLCQKRMKRGAPPPGQCIRNQRENLK